MRPRLLLFALPLAVSASAAQSQSAEELRNWFDDPFFQISSAIPGCPVPAGPFVTEAERRAEAHLRAEKGTTCWLAGQCDRPSAYLYDRDIAAAFKAAIAERNPFADTSLWVTVQGRVVYIEGCVRKKSLARELEAFARALPHVQQASALVRSRPSERAPYRLRSTQ
jgi:hypothetical protein